MNFMIDWNFFEVPIKPISKETILGYIAGNRKRICFADTHKNALRDCDEGSDVLAWLNLPFKDTIGPIMNYETHVSLLDKIDRVCFPVKDIKQLEDLRKFINDYHDLVFLKDNMELSVALSMNMENDMVSRTPIGESEYKVKYRAAYEDVSEAKNFLSKELEKCLARLPYYNKADYICAVPSSHKFVKEIICNLTDWYNKDISNHLSWTSKQADIKNENNPEKKLAKLEQSGFKVQGIDLKGKTIVLVDDLYKSGATMQFVAMKLKEAGAKRVFGICFVKSRSNQ